MSKPLFSANNQERNNIVPEKCSTLEKLFIIVSNKWVSQPNEVTLKAVLELSKTLHLNVVDISHCCETHQTDVFCQTSYLVYKTLQIFQNIISDCFSDQSMEQKSKCLFISTNIQKLSYIVFIIVKTGIVRHLSFQVTTLSIKEEGVASQPCSSISLFQTIRTLLTTCNKFSDGWNILLKPYLLDILSGLLQLTYHPTYNTVLDKVSASSCAKLLTDVLTNWAQLSDVVKCLFTLQGFASCPSPLWLRKACGNFLSKCLLRESGVESVISTLISVIGGEITDDKKAQIIAHIISTPSQAGKVVDEYISSVSSQILTCQMVTLKRRNENYQLFNHVLAEILFDLYRKYPKQTTLFYFSQLLSPFYKLCDVSQTLQQYQKSPYTILQSLDCLQNLLLFKIAGKKSVICNKLSPFVIVFFEIYIQARTSVSHIQGLLQNLIASILKAQSIHKSVEIVLRLGNIESEKHKNLLLYKMDKKNGFLFTEDGVAVSENIFADQHSPDKVIESQDRKVEGIISILNLCNDVQLPSHVFLALIQLLAIDDFEQPHEELTEKLLTIEDRAIEHLKSGEGKLVACALLTSLLENNDPTSLLSDIDQICNFVKTMLTGVIEQNKNDAQTENLRLCFAVVSVCLLREPDEKQKSILDLLPLFQTLSVDDKMPVSDRETAHDLSVAIATYGVGSNLDITAFSRSLQRDLKQFTEESTETQTESQRSTANVPKENINFNKTPVNNTCEAPSSSGNYTATSSKDATTSLDKSSFTNIKTVNVNMEEMFDPSPPIRAAAVRQLAELVKQGLCKESPKKMYEMVMERLQVEEDSFVYLSLIKALTEIVAREKFALDNVDSLFDRLLVTFRSSLMENTESGRINAMKCGEVLVRFIQQLGDLAPLYARKLLPVLLIGAGSKSAPVRATSLSNLADLCPLLRHALHSIENELTECVIAISKTDDDVTARRAAVYVIRSLVDTLGIDIVQIFPSTIKSIYSCLKHIYTTENDGASTLHAQLALEQLKLVMNDAIFMSPLRKNKSPTKKIVILPT